MFAVEIDTVTKAFQSVTAVDRLSLSVAEGAVSEFIEGRTSSGKSTTRLADNRRYHSARYRNHSRVRAGTVRNAVE